MPDTEGLIQPWVVFGNFVSSLGRTRFASNKTVLFQWTISLPTLDVPVAEITGLDVHSKALESAELCCPSAMNIAGPSERKMVGYPSTALRLPRMMFGKADLPQEGLRCSTARFSIQSFSVQFGHGLGQVFKIEFKGARAGDPDETGCFR